MALTLATLARGQGNAATTPLYCRRCGNPRPLGMVSPGRFWSRQGGRTIIAEGGKVRVWCEKCSAEHEVDLTARD